MESSNARGKVRQVTGDAAGYFDVDEVPAGPLTFGTLAPVQRISGVNLEAGAEPYVVLVLDWGDAAVAGHGTDRKGGNCRRDLTW